jgi:DNA-binding transcriptional LysR family regulator
MADRLAVVATFCAVVETGGFTAAGRRLRVSKALVSKRIADLEAGLGVRLLQRSTRRLEPTAEGTRFYAGAREALLRLDEAFEEAGAARDDLTGLVRVAAPMAFGVRFVAPPLAALAGRHPGLEVALHLDDNLLAIAGRGFDLGLRIGRRVLDPALVARRIVGSPRILCCSPGYAARHGLPRSVAELAGHAAVGFSSTDRPHVWAFGEAEDGTEGAVERVEVRCRFLANSGAAMAEALLAGIGLGVMPLFFVDEALRRGTLVEALPRTRPTPEAIYAVFPASQGRLRRVRAAADHLAEHIRTHLPQR